jgi:HlyD family secretion protein
MSQQLFPKEIIENTQERNFSKHTTRSKLIYSTIVIFVILAISSLPFIKIDVGVRGQGMIRPVTEVMKIVSPVSGTVVRMQGTENSLIEKGDVIVTLDDADIADRLDFIQNKQQELRAYLSDIEYLKKNIPNLLSIEFDPRTERYRHDFLEYKQELQNSREAIDQKKRSFERESTLYSQGASSLLAFEESEYLYQQQKSNHKLLIEQKQNAWSLEATSFQNEIDELASEKSQLENKIKLYAIHSPVKGTLQNLNSVSANSFIYSNQVIAEISPDTTIIAEVYIPPNDIGLLRLGLPVKIQVDAFDHNQWGTISGTIENISSDMTLIENTPVFKVRCTLDRSFLELSNGFKGEIKKGMTFQARFVINRRSLFQLLYDNVDDWLNPSWSSPKSQVASSNT